MSSPSRDTARSTASATTSPNASTTNRRTPQPVVAAKPADLVLRIERVSDVCCPTAVAVVTADGRFVTWDGSMFLERVLTVDGVRRVRDEIVATGLFAKDQSVTPDLVPGATLPPPHGVTFFLFRTWSDGRTVTVSTPLIDKSEEALYQPSPARTRLEQLASKVLSPEQWLPASAWVRSTPTFSAAAAYRLFSSAERVGGSPASVNAVEWPFTTPLPSFGDVVDPMSMAFAVSLGPGDPMRCATITADDAQAVRAALERAGASVYAVIADGSFRATLATGIGDGGIVLLAQPLLPDQSSCIDKY